MPKPAKSPRWRLYVMFLATDSHGDTALPLQATYAHRSSAMRAVIRLDRALGTGDMIFSLAKEA